MRNLRRCGSRGRHGLEKCGQTRVAQGAERHRSRMIMVKVAGRSPTSGHWRFGSRKCWSTETSRATCARLLAAWLPSVERIGGPPSQSCVPAASRMHREPARPRRDATLRCAVLVYSTPLQMLLAQDSRAAKRHADSSTTLSRECAIEHLLGCCDPSHTSYVPAFEASRGCSIAYASGQRAGIGRAEASRACCRALLKTAGSRASDLCMDVCAHHVVARDVVDAERGLGRAVRALHRLLAHLESTNRSQS